MPGRLREVRQGLARRWLSAKIRIRWEHDRRHIPLTPAHRELYDIILRLCHEELGEFPDLVDCRDFNDRIQWLKLFDQSREIVRCSDKLLVRDYVRERVGDDYLTELYQVREHCTEIDFDALPSAFVIKTNHDSGTVFLVRDRAAFDRDAAFDRIEDAMVRAYGWRNGEWAYSYIRPKVFVEEFIGSEGDSPPPDYKFHCSDGKVLWLQFIAERGSRTREEIVTPEGRVTGIHFNDYMRHTGEFACPGPWEQMKAVAGELSRGHKYVRVDLYCVQDRIYFGELTFYPLMGCIKGAGQKPLGRLLDFDRTTTKPCILAKLETERSRREFYRVLE